MKNSAPAVAILAAVTLCSSLAAQQTLLDDFASGTDALWQRIDRLAGTGLGTTVYTVPSGRYRIASSQAIPALPMLVATAAANLDSIANPGNYADGRVQVTMRLDNDATNALVAMRYDLAAQSGYGFAANNVENRIYISRLFGTNSVTLASTPFGLAANTDYVVAGECFGDRLALKVWLAGSPEPALPQLTVQNTAFAGGALGLAIYNQASNLGGTGGQLSAQFDDVYFTRYAATATYGAGCPGSWNATPGLAVSGQPTGGGTFSFDLSQNAATSLAALVVGFARSNVGLGACTLLVDPSSSVSLLLPTNGSGAASQSLTIPLGFPALVLDAQSFALDAPSAFAASLGLELIFP